MKVSQWITCHGLALNVTTDLTPFQHIVPCGIRNRQVGSILGLLGEFRSFDGRETADRKRCELIDVAHEALIKEFSEVFQLKLHQKPIHMLSFGKGEPSTSPLVKKDAVEDRKQHA